MGLLCHWPTISSTDEWMRFFQFLFLHSITCWLNEVLKKVLNSKILLRLGGLTLALTDFFGFGVYFHSCWNCYHILSQNLLLETLLFADVRSYNPCEDLILLWPTVVLFSFDDPSTLGFFFSWKCDSTRHTAIESSKIEKNTIMSNVCLWICFLQRLELMFFEKKIMTPLVPSVPLGKNLWFYLFVKKNFV